MHVERIPDVLIEVDKDVWVNPTYIRSVAWDPPTVGRAPDRVIVEFANGESRLLSRGIDVAETVRKLNPQPLVLNRLSGDNLG